MRIPRVSQTFLLSFALLLSACGQVKPPVGSVASPLTSSPITSSPSVDVAVAPDLAPGVETRIHGQGIALPNALPDFFFMEPLNKAGKSDKDKFDFSLASLLTVTVCRISGPTCVVLETLNSNSPKSSQLRLDGNKYMTKWSGKTASLVPGDIVRLSVSITSLTLGSMDLTVLDKEKSACRPANLAVSTAIKTSKLNSV